MTTRGYNLRQLLALQREEMNETKDDDSIGHCLIGGVIRSVNELTVHRCKKPYVRHGRSSIIVLVPHAHTM